MSHNQLKNVITQYLMLKGYIVANFYAGGLMKDGKYIKRKNATGVSDLICCSPSGKFIAIEVKVKPDKPNDCQEGFLSEVEQNSGIAIVAYSLDDVVDKLKQNNL